LRKPLLPEPVFANRFEAHRRVRMAGRILLQTQDKNENSCAARRVSVL
jgi:hypothetical protein